MSRKTAKNRLFLQTRQFKRDDIIVYERVEICPITKKGKHRCRMMNL